jgi:hypothetical protein
MPKLIHCPFYLYERGCEIHCEGKRVKQFSSPLCKTIHIGKHCGSILGWQGCEQASKINEKYEEKEYV